MSKEYQNRALADATEFPSPKMKEYNTASNCNGGNCTGPPSNCYGGVPVKRARTSRKK